MYRIQYFVHVNEAVLPMEASFDNMTDEDITSTLRASQAFFEYGLGYPFRVVWLDERHRSIKGSIQGAAEYVKHFFQTQLQGVSYSRSRSSRKANAAPLELHVLATTLSQHPVESDSPADGPVVADSPLPEYSSSSALQLALPPHKAAALEDPVPQTLSSLSIAAAAPQTTLPDASASSARRPNEPLITPRTAESSHILASSTLVSTTLPAASASNDPALSLDASAVSSSGSSKLRIALPASSAARARARAPLSMECANEAVHVTAPKSVLTGLTKPADSELLASPVSSIPIAQSSAATTVTATVESSSASAIELSPPKHSQGTTRAVLVPPSLPHASSSSLPATALAPVAFPVVVPVTALANVVSHASGLTSSVSSEVANSGIDISSKPIRKRSSTSPAKERVLPNRAKRSYYGNPLKQRDDYASDAEHDDVQEMQSGSPPTLSSSTNTDTPTQESLPEHAIAKKEWKPDANREERASTTVPSNLVVPAVSKTLTIPSKSFIGLVSASPAAQHDARKQLSDRPLSGASSAGDHVAMREAPLVSSTNVASKSADSHSVNAVQKHLVPHDSKSDNHPGNDKEVEDDADDDDDDDDEKDGSNAQYDKHGTPPGCLQVFDEMGWVPTMSESQTAIYQRLTGLHNPSIGLIVCSKCHKPRMWLTSYTNILSGDSPYRKSPIFYKGYVCGMQMDENRNKWGGMVAIEPVENCDSIIHQRVFGSTLSTRFRLSSRCMSCNRSDLSFDSYHFQDLLQKRGNGQSLFFFCKNCAPRFVKPELIPKR
eukprot:ANDGO_06912.mRNA.1 hypothetical protein